MAPLTETRQDPCRDPTPAQPPPPQSRRSIRWRRCSHHPRPLRRRSNDQGQRHRYRPQGDQNRHQFELSDVQRCTLLQSTMLPPWIYQSGAITEQGCGFSLKLTSNPSGYRTVARTIWSDQEKCERVVEVCNARKKEMTNLYNPLRLVRILRDFPAAT